uniref:Uncharacterized protein n=1 Tax=uncultured bacterium BLR9 TaxID=506525 RepID=C0INB3_9BACT|nr:hypothetical protein AKSOIL_0154 [uncultured bacterium BLR9]
MTEALAGRYFLPGSAHFVTARARLDGPNFRIVDDAGTVLSEMPLKHVRVSSRLGSIPRRFDVPGGGCFETDDNDGADALLAGGGRHASRLHRWEGSWRWALGSLAVAGVATYAFVIYGIPAGALWLAQQTPPSVGTLVERQALQVLDNTLLEPTTLNTAARVRARTLFARVAAKGKRGSDGYRLLFRDSKAIGPNAMALPDGSIVMTDQLWELVQKDDEIEGVFAHEIAHVDRAHTLQRLYQAAIVPAAIAIMTGDLSQITTLATVLPGVLVQAAYSRDLEQEADDDAAVTVKALGDNPAGLADLLERMEKKICGETACGSGWLSDHPETDRRMQRLRQQALPPKKDSI